MLRLALAQVPAPAPLVQVFRPAGPRVRAAARPTPAASFAQPLDHAIGEVEDQCAGGQAGRQGQCPALGEAFRGGLEGDAGDQRAGTEAEDNANEPLVSPPGDAQHSADEQGGRRKRSPAECLPHRWSFPGTAFTSWCEPGHSTTPGAIARLAGRPSCPLVITATTAPAITAIPIRRTKASPSCGQSRTATAKPPGLIVALKVAWKSPAISTLAPEAL